MDVNYVQSSSFSYKYTIIMIIALTNFPKSVCSLSKEFKACGNTFNCGNLTDLSYPFYGLGRPQYCGHPGFELLDCDQHANPVKLMILSQAFYVLGINKTARTMDVARIDFKAKSGCPDTLVNITIDFSLFQYTSSDANITLLYDDCSSKCSNPFPCPMTGIGNLPVCFMTNSMMLNSNASEVTCRNHLFLPVHLSDYLAMDKAQSYNPSSSWNGFELQWTANNALCDSCLKSGGQCGHDPKSNKFFCFCTDESKCPFSGSSASTLAKYQIALLVCAATIGIGMLLMLVLCVKARCSSNNRVSEDTRRKRKLDVEAFLRNHGSSGPKRYTYTDLKKITNSFTVKLGEGAFGTVYRGSLPNGKMVAVKLIKQAKADAEDFMNEVASIGKTNHVNVVTLLGFCYEGHKRALVYDFMVNGSLEKFLYAGNNHLSLGWEVLFQIAVGIARGLEYLHQGCNTRILHFDIKPHNILLDENFCPKISDFGLSKSCPQKDSVTISMSEARGTVGYIAPEVFLRSFGGVTYKSDVYSYGMLVLEMVGCRRKVEVKGELSSEQSFPQWIYEQLEAGEEPYQQEMLSSEEIDMQKKMILVSLWCVKTNPSSRPTMNKVVEMLEGPLDSLHIPRASSLSTPLSLQSMTYPTVSNPPANTSMDK